MRVTPPLIALAALSGCVTDRPVMAPDGRQGHYIECPRSIDLCMDRAASLCPQGYDLIDSGGQSGAVAQTYHGPYTSNTIVTPTFRGYLAIACKPPRPRAAPQVAPTTCTPLLGMYTVRHIERDGTCGPVREELSSVDMRLPTDCRTTWENGCGMNFDCSMPADGNARPLRVKGIVRWDARGNQGGGVEEWLIEPGNNLPGCSSTYDVTYMRQ